MKSIYTLCALLGAVSLFTPTTASARECKPVEGDSNLQDCNGWVCRDVGRGLFQCIDFDLKVEWTTDCPGCEGILPSAEPGDCGNRVAGFDLDGREVSACADDGGLALANALDVAGQRGFDVEGAAWCSTDVDGREVCTSDLGDFGLGEGIPSAMKCDGHQDHNGQCKVFCDGLEYWCVNRWVTYQCWGFTAGGAVNPHNTTWGLGSICTSSPALPDADPTWTDDTVEDDTCSKRCCMRSATGTCLWWSKCDGSCKPLTDAPKGSD